MTIEHLWPGVGEPGRWGTGDYSAYLAMRIAYIWYNPDERSMVEQQIREQKRTWELVCMPEETTCTLNAILRLLRTGYDAILVHLSLRFCLALKMAEVIHRENVSTKVILFSRTMSDRAALSGLFDGDIHPDRDMFSLTSRIETIVGKPRVIITDEREIDERIVRIFNSSDTLKAGYLRKFPVRHKREFTLEDYNKAIGASAKLDWGEPGVNQRDVFISYSRADKELAAELGTLLSQEGVTSFMAERDLDGGDKWEAEIRHALAAATEVILILTPNSIASKWVMIEAGAAWSLEKTITPCVAFVDLKALPEPIGKHQARSISTEDEKKRVLAEIKARTAARKI